MLPGNFISTAPRAMSDAIQERDREVPGTSETVEKRNRRLHVGKNEERVGPTAPRCREKLCNCPINILHLI